MFTFVVFGCEFFVTRRGTRHIDVSQRDSDCGIKITANTLHLYLLISQKFGAWFPGEVEHFHFST